MWVLQNWVQHKWVRPRVGAPPGGCAHNWVRYNWVQPKWVRPQVGVPASGCGTTGCSRSGCGTTRCSRSVCGTTGCRRSGCGTIRCSTSPCPVVDPKIKHFFLCKVFGLTKLGPNTHLEAATNLDLNSTKSVTLLAAHLCTGPSLALQAKSRGQDFEEVCVFMCRHEIHLVPYMARLQTDFCKKYLQLTLYH
jgi:hypothetical protein